MTNPIVGIGELLWDVYPDGRRVAGGAPFNFAFHCHQLGHPAVIVSRVGNDDLGRELRERVRELGLSDEYIQTDHEHPTGTVQVTLDANAVPTYTITENVAWDFIEWEPKLSLLREFAEAAVYGTLAQRHEHSAETIHEFLLHLASGFRVFDVNHRKTRWHAKELRTQFERARWIKFNTDEVRTVVETCGLTQEGHLPNVSDLIPMLYSRMVIVTHGERGCEIFENLGCAAPILEPGVPAKVVDTVGAGDSFTAAMVCLHLEGRSLQECAKFAVHYAARVCEQPGGTPRIDRQEVERAAFGAR